MPLVLLAAKGNHVYSTGEGIVRTRGTITKESARKIRQPQVAECIDERFARIPCNVQFADIERNGCRYSVITPDLHDVADALRLVVQRAPGNLARFKRIMLERHER